METTQATAPASAQVQTPVHPIHEETATVNALTQWVQDNPDNDPHQGTDLEEQKSGETEPQGAEPQEPAAESIELDEEAPLFEIEYKTDSGKEQKKLSLKELREGYLAKQDYHRNIQKVKQQEADLAKQVQEASNKAAQEYIQRLEIQKQSVTRLAGVKTMQEIEALAASDPAAAQQEFLRMINVNQTLQSIEQEQRTAAEKLNQDRLSQRQQTVKQTWEKLSSEIPDWSQETYAGLLKFSQEEYGFDAREVIDAGVLKAIHDAKQFRSLQKAKPEIAKRVVAVPKVLKPGSADKPNPAQEQASRAHDRLKKTGSVEDAVAAYLSRQKK